VDIIDLNIVYGSVILLHLMIKDLIIVNILIQNKHKEYLFCFIAT